jgi:hypothetical protein
VTADHFGSGERIDPILLQKLVTTRYPARTVPERRQRLQKEDVFIELDGMSRCVLHHVVDSAEPH